MKRMIVLVLSLLLLAVPVCADTYLVLDGSGLLEDHDVARLEELYGQYTDTHGFTPALLTVDSFGGLSAEDFASQYYDVQEYPQNGILFLVSLEEGQWYILTNGECHHRISDSEAQAIGEELAPMIKSGSAYAAFLRFPELAGEIFLENAPDGVQDGPQDQYVTVPAQRNYGKTIAISMAVGLGIGLVAVGVMAAQMKSVRSQNSAADYVRPGSMQLNNSRDIFLYSHVTRTAKPKNNSSSGGRSHSGGGSRGGAGGRF